MYRIAVAALATAALFGSATLADAQGRVAGAAVGGVIGAKSHHAVAGAVVGGMVGHHMAKKKAQKQAAKATPK